MEQRLLEVEVRASDAGDGRTTVAGVASNYGLRNAHGEVFVPGAFARTLAQRQGPLSMTWQHRDVIGKWSIPPTRETHDGLQVEGTISQTDTGRNASVLARDGAVNGLSVGFNPADGGYTYAKAGQSVTFQTPYGSRSYREEESTWYVTDADLFEVGLVMAPSDSAARVSMVRAKALRALPALAGDATLEDAAFSMALLFGARGAPAFSDLSTLERESLYRQVADVYEANGATPPEWDASPDYQAVEFRHDERAIYARRELEKRLAKFLNALAAADEAGVDRVPDRAEEAAAALRGLLERAKEPDLRDVIADLRAAKEAIGG